MKKLFFFLLAISLLSISGCAKGTNFVTALEPPTGKSVVYFYRLKRFVASGDFPTVVDNGVKVTRLVNGGYYGHIVDPGKHVFHTKTLAIDKGVTIDIKEGEKHYLRLDLTQGAWVSTWKLTRMFEEGAVAELKHCRGAELSNQI